MIFYGRNFFCLSKNTGTHRNPVFFLALHHKRISKKKSLHHSNFCHINLRIVFHVVNVLIDDWWWLYLQFPWTDMHAKWTMLHRILISTINFAEKNLVFLVDFLVFWKNTTYFEKNVWIGLLKKVLIIFKGLLLFLMIIQVKKLRWKRRPVPFLL